MVIAAATRNARISARLPPLRAQAAMAFCR
jgi:hypothetical protein